MMPWKTFAKITGIEAADAIGFGKAPKTGSEQLFYLAGKVGGTNGIFRSVDGMKSWSRIDDDAHQYGSIDVITGDPRVFGRVYIGTNGRGIPFGEPK